MKAATDRNGNAMLDYKLDAAHVLIAQRGSDVSMLPFNQPALDLSEFAVAGREQAWFDVFAWSGRDLYRPGETVRLSALLRDQDGQPVGGARARACSRCSCATCSPTARPSSKRSCSPTRRATCAIEQVIPVDAATGRWRVEFRTDPGEQGAVQGMTLRVEEFLPERMKLDLDRAGRDQARRTGARCRRPAPISMARRPRATASPPSSPSRSSSIRWSNCPAGSSAIRPCSCRRKPRTSSTPRSTPTASCAQDIALPAEAKPVSADRRDRHRQRVRERRPQRQPQPQARAVAGRRAGRRAPAVRRQGRRRRQRQRRLRTRALRRRRQAAPGQGSARHPGARTPRLPLELERRRRLGLRLQPPLRGHRDARGRCRRGAASASTSRWSGASTASTCSTRRPG